MLVGMEESKTFHEKRVACIRRKYDMDEIGQRIYADSVESLDEQVGRSKKTGGGLLYKYLGVQES